MCSTSESSISETKGRRAMKTKFSPPPGPLRTRVKIFPIRRFVLIRRFFRRFVPLGVLSHQTFCLQAFCPIRRFVPLGVLSLGVFQAFCPIRRFVPLGVLSVRRFVFRRYVFRRYVFQALCLQAFCTNTSDLRSNNGLRLCRSHVIKKP